MQIADKLWWAYKRYIHQVEHAQKGKGIEEHFARQNLHFDPSKRLVEECAVTFSAGGDLMSKPFLTRESAQHVWDEISNFYFDADIVYANLESLITHANSKYTLPQRKTTPSMNNSPEMLEVFYRGGKGITFFGTANDHCMDMGTEGLVGTLDLLDAHNCVHTGTARTESERDDLLIIEKNGVRIAFLAYTFSLHLMGKTRRLTNHIWRTTSVSIHQMWIFRLSKSRSKGEAEPKSRCCGVWSMSSIQPKRSCEPREA
ncbi:CapA family protein [Sporolactobacillus sp. STCC-11]|uniref:CapA family protein n=1 Tax=Sporolactobacillus caesalpiniae TaxID=3230362 RepID=UPI003395AEA3